ncbi:Methionyl-tRNA formyltransferase [Friedmanniomyces endolithicus]|nr:Methionyl-tRNA formyltransferase [Friedmanniomyces endolithicus]KAK0313477.1 Methionyl-tRNA formyltransferase [Friedmanniomyces endolithicus]KAK0830267.1 Methionyl-tRNA formyltransferase [Friedmanniomyces endolithicus]
MLRRSGFLGRTITSTRRYSSLPAIKHHDPLHILFCGADRFSIHSLRALTQLRKSRPDKIASIDVLCRPDKRVGRGYKRTQSVPIKPVAAEFGLTLHQNDSLKDWQAPIEINLIVAVSFGLLVPGRLLSAAKYGGLNVHPSLLPQLSGPAPIQRALLQNCTETGVTLQTMHPTRFDHGAILSQETTAIDKERRLDVVVDLLGSIGADLLSKGIESGAFIPPLPAPELQQSAHPASYASKITPEDRRIDWATWTAADIILRDEVLGSLWDSVTYSRCENDGPNLSPGKRVKFGGPWRIIELLSGTRRLDLSRPGRPELLDETHGPGIRFLTVDGHHVQPREITVEGRSKGSGHQMLASLLGGIQRAS